MAEYQIEVKILRNSTIAPAIPTVKHRMFLSGMDIASMPYNNMKTLIFYKIPAPVKEFSTIVEELKMSLSLVLVEFYPFAGRLDINGGKSCRTEIECNDGGVEFVEASIDMAFQDVETDHFQHKSFFEELVRTRRQNDGSLLSIQVTAFKEGGFCMGANFHHGIADGKSFWHFMKCWAECSRGLPISENPQHMRTYFKRDKENHSIPNISMRAKKVMTERIKDAQIFSIVRHDSLAAEDSEINVITSGVSEENTENSSIQRTIKEETTLEISTFEFTEKMIQKLKERSGAATSFVAVAAQFWRCSTKAREVPEKASVYFATPIDLRDRVKPPLPATYFGNCLGMGIAGTTAKNLLEQDVCFAAALIQECIKSCTTEEQLNYLMEGIEFHERINSTVKNLFGGYMTVVGMSPNFPVYEIDHGWGRPLSVQNLMTKPIGQMIVLPGKGGGRSIAVSTELPRHQMETFKRIVMIIPD